MQKNIRETDPDRGTDMKLFLKLTDEVIKQNLRQLVLFPFLYRLVAGIFYIKTVNSILRFSLHMAGYSYLYHRQSEGLFLLRPVTVFAVIFILFLEWHLC